MDRPDKLALAAFVLFVAALGLFQVMSIDLGVHLAAGAYTVEHGIPTTNVFSPFNADHPILQHEWAFQVATYAIAALGGVGALSWARLAVVLGIGALLASALRPGRGFAVGLAVLGLGIFVAHPRFIWRPELITLLLLALELKLLIDFTERGRDRLMWLPAVFVVWANVHGYFLAGLIVLGCFGAGELLQERLGHARRGASSRLLKIGGLCALACLVNPYFYEGALYPFREVISVFSDENPFVVSVRELGPPSAFWDLWAVRAWYPLLAVFLLSAALQGRRVRVAYLLTAVAVWLMARSTFRNIGLFGITLGALAAVQCRGARVWALAPLVGPRLSRIVAGGVAASFLGAALFVGSNWLYIRERLNRQFGPGVANELDLPSRRFIAEHIPADRQVFNSFGLGSRYLGWFYPQRRPFIDGNGSGYPFSFFSEYRDLVGCREPFELAARKYGIAWAYLQLNKPLAVCLYRSPRWHPVHLDSESIILVPQTPEFEALIEAFDLRGELAQGRVPGWAPTSRATWLRASGPRNELNLGRFLARVGEFRAARTVLEHVLELEPGNPSARKLLEQMRSRRQGT